MDEIRIGEKVWIIDLRLTKTYRFNSSYKNGCNGPVLMEINQKSVRTEGYYDLKVPGSVYSYHTRIYLGNISNPDQPSFSGRHIFAVFRENEESEAINYWNTALNVAIDIVNSDAEKVIKKINNKFKSNGKI